MNILELNDFLFNAGKRNQSNAQVCEEKGDSDKFFTCGLCHQRVPWQEWGTIVDTDLCEVCEGKIKLKTLDI